MLKVMTIVGTRPELIKMSRVIDIFDKNSKHILVHTGQNYDFELNQIFFEDLNIRKPDYFLNASAGNSVDTIANIIKKSNEVILKELPDAVLLYGDTNSCLSAISAKKNKIPIFHMEAGNRCFDQRVPEEINRKIVDHISDINLVLTEHARRYLIQEGIRQETIFKVGSHLHEVLNFYRPKIEKSNILKKLKLLKNKYFLVSLHREENIDSISNLELIVESLNCVADKYKVPVLVSTHPRTQKKLSSYIKKKKFSKNIIFNKPFGFFDYIKLQTNAKCVISDSGTITEESALLNFPAITIRQINERPEGFDAGVLIMSGLSKDRVIDAIELSVNNYKKSESNQVSDYVASNVSRTILNLVYSYTEYVNSYIWKK
jgi:UDP-N-acetylglucosamine 2-epimerase (non-hydrolysing)